MTMGKGKGRQGRIEGDAVGPTLHPSQSSTLEADCMWMILSLSGIRTLMFYLLVVYRWKYMIYK